MSTFYTIPDEQKDFWGSELLNVKQQVDISGAQERIKAYTDAHKLRGEKEFRLDDVLQRILKTERKFMLLSEIPDHLAYLMAPPRPKTRVRPARDDWCPATQSDTHEYGKAYKLGNAYSGPVYGKDCIKCEYHYIDQ